MEIWEVLDKNRQKTGKTVERGMVLNADEFHLVVDVWIKNDEGNYLITKRTPNKSFPNMWTICGGSAILGDTSLEAALREVKEEVGLSLNVEKGKLIKSFRRESSNLRSFKDVWLFNENINIDDVVHQIDEVSESMWASKSKILDMIQTGQFIDVLTYLDEII